MPRSNRRFYPSMSIGFDESSQYANDEVSDMEVDDDTEEIDIIEDLFDDNSDAGECCSDLLSHISTVPDTILTFVAAGCLDRITDAGFRRLLASQEDLFREEAWKLWKNRLSTFSKHYICNSCGKELMASYDECCGAIIKYVRVGAFTQLVDITRQHIFSILKLRSDLKNGNGGSHNLTGSYLKKVWLSETGNQLKLSIIASIDGVALAGNTKSKLWPVTMLLVDLPTSQMQKAHNLALHGIAEGSENPSTAFWNALVPKIYSDIEATSTEIKKMVVSFTISSWVADQPAKRSLFGMRACNSANSCFFGECPGTLYKTLGPNRSEDAVDSDAAEGRNGFGPVPPKIVEFLNPSDTVIDILHTASEGIFALIMKEVFGGNGLNRRSDLFENDAGKHLELCKTVVLPPRYSCDYEKLSNCSERLDYFRLNFGLSALINPSLKPKARLVICSLMLLLNRLYSNSPTISGSFYAYLTGAARWALETSNQSYLSMKTHELLCHLPGAIEKFGNVAPLSTFCFEHFYKYSLKGFNAQKTKGFLEAAISRVMVHSAVRREITVRAKESPSSTLQLFLNETPEWRQFSISYKNSIPSLRPDEYLPELEGYDFFATLSLSVGRLQSRYRLKNTREEIFFAENGDEFHGCYRFIALCVLGDDKLILAERIRPVSPADNFSRLQELVDSMERPTNTYAFNVLIQFRRCDGILHGTPSGELETLQIDCVKGLGGYVKHESSAFYVQINGSCVHH